MHGSQLIGQAFRLNFREFPENSFAEATSLGCNWAIGGQTKMELT